jgi:3,4-dihydroxy 2-butanone 4-phosphate synthase/GTP cyclohydrolase II
MDDDGHMSRGGRLTAFAERHGLKMVTVAHLIQYRMRNESLVTRVAQPRLANEFGEWRLIAYASEVEGKTHLALVMGEIDGTDPVMVRVHSECVTGEVFGSMRCDCGGQLREAMRMISEEGAGAIVYLRQEGRGIGLNDKLRAYELQEKGHDTVEANQALGYPPDMRDYGVGAQILKDLGVKRLRYITNNPHKFVAIRGYGLEIVDRIPIEIPTEDPETLRYLKTKKEKLGHLFSKY